MRQPPIRPRLTLAQIMAFVVVVAVVFAACSASPSPAQLSLLILAFLLDVGALGTALLGIIYRRGTVRGFWIGFAAFEVPSLLWLMVLLVEWVSPIDAVPLTVLLFGVVPFAWIGGSIGRQFAAAAEAARPTE